MFTKQETFDIVVVHARKQKVRAVTPRSIQTQLGGGCRYRMEGGRMCFAGVLIPDDRYDEKMEGSGITYSGGPSIVGRLLQELGHDYKFVAELQTIHDAMDSDLSMWEPKFQELAEKHGLEVLK